MTRFGTEGAAMTLTTMCRRFSSAAMLLLAVTMPSTPARATPPPVDLDQGWTDAERDWWYGVSQGSRLIPLSWFKVLEQPGSTASFLDRDNIIRYRYLPRPSPSDRLPVGFVVDSQDDDPLSVTKLRWKAAQGRNEQWVGLNCSACHTAEMTYKGQVIRVDGGPTLADLQTFFTDMTRALAETRDQPDKFDRFAQHVLEQGNDEVSRALLKSALTQLVAFQEDIRTMNEAPIRYGYGRLDAIGFIFNKVSRVASGNASSANPSTAPVSYPFIWNIPQHDRVQWNGIAQNKSVGGVGGQPFDIGALGRNTGEVIGVFADIKPVKDPGLLTGFVSSVDVEGLVSLEQRLGKLRPPRWPAEVLGAIDQAREEAGKALFQKHCVGCHANLQRTDLDTPIKARMTRLNDKAKPELSIGTDPWMACNAYTYDATSGVLAGFKNKYFTGPKIGQTAFLSDLLTIEIAGALLGKKKDVVKTAAASFFGLNRPPKVITEAAFVGKATPAQRLKKCMTDESDLLAYKGRPLTGIWATAPYLHNGSVPTLYDLLLPPDQRPKSFPVGTREFDPTNVGYVTSPSPENSFTFATEDAAGKPLDGNSNLGHDYGNAGFADEQRRALVEYMKSL
jgi:hypothetical protein